MKDLIIFGIGIVVGVTVAVVVMRRSIEKYMNSWNDRPLKLELDAPPQDRQARADRV